MRKIQKRALVTGCCLLGAASFISWKVLQLPFKAGIVITGVALKENDTLDIKRIKLRVSQGMTVQVNEPAWQARVLGYTYVLGDTTINVKGAYLAPDIKVNAVEGKVIQFKNIILEAKKNEKETLTDTLPSTYSIRVK
jgi:hypothetical protein